MNKSIQLGIYIILGIFLITSCGGPAQNNMPTSVPVNVDTVALGDPTFYDLYPGNVIALNQVQLNSEVSGFITDISFQEGQQVRKGQKLYEIEQSKYAASYASAEAGLRLAKANLEKNQKDYDRYKELGQKGMATQQRQEYSVADLETAKSQVATAEAELIKARTDLKHATITAPFDGTIGISLVKLGAFVTGGQTRLNTISSNDPIAVDFVISEKEISRFLNLQKQKHNTSDSLFTLVLPDKSTYAHPGSILFLDRAVDPQTGTLKIRLTFPNPKHELRDGMSCNIKVKNKQPERVIVVPNKAVTEQMGEFFIYVVEKDTARQHKVQLGSVIGKNVIVLNGLKTGEQIVTEGVQKLRDGAAVQLNAPTQTEGPKK